MMGKLTNFFDEGLEYIAMVYPETRQFIDMMKPQLIAKIDDGNDELHLFKIKNILHKMISTIEQLESD